jgi:hypothetical protein
MVLAKRKCDLRNQTRKILIFVKHLRIDSSPVRRYESRQRKRYLNFLSQGSLMNSQRARNYIVSAALVVAVLFFDSLLFAQLLVTVKTPGANFSGVGTKGKADNVAGGRRFRAPASEDLKIRGLLRVPQSASGVSKIQLLQHWQFTFAPVRQVLHCGPLSCSMARTVSFLSRRT